MLIAVIDVRGQTHYLDPKLIRHIAAVQRHDMVRTVVMTGDGRCFDSIDDVETLTRRIRSVSPSRSVMRHPFRGLLLRTRLAAAWRRLRDTRAAA